MRDDDERPWTWIGFRFGLGFWAAGALFSALGAMLTWFILTHEFSTAQSRTQAAAQAAERAMHRAPPVAREERTLVIVPPRSTEACKALTSGLINEEFARCRRGYTETR